VVEGRVMIKSTVDIKEATSIIVGEGRDGELYQVWDDSCKFNLAIVTKLGDSIINLSSMEAYDIDDCRYVGIKKLPKYSSVTLTQE